MAGVVLGTRAVTLLPRPVGGIDRESVRQAFERSPRYLRLLESWRWSSPLWRAGVISAEADDDPAADSLAAVYEHIRLDDALSSLRPLTRAADELRDTADHRFLDALSADMIRGGPDPGMSIPVNSALERFARRHGLVLARGPVASVAQRAESRLGRKVFSIGLPMLLGAGGQRILALRSDLDRPLRAVRTAISDILDETASGSPVADLTGLQVAVADFSRRFTAWAETDLARGDDETGKRVVLGYIGLSGVIMPADAVLRSSRAAVQAMRGVGAGRTEPAGSRVTAEPGERSAGALTLLIREMQVRPES